MTNTFVLATCGLFFIILMVLTRANRHSLKILEPLFAFVVACVCLIHFAIPAKYMSIPSWPEFSVAILIAIMIVGILNIAFGSLSTEWRMAKYFGWTVLASTFFLRPLFESSWAPYAAPLACSLIEGIACLIFASRLYYRRPIIG